MSTINKRSDPPAPVVQAESPRSLIASSESVADENVDPAMSERLSPIVAPPPRSVIVPNFGCISAVSTNTAAVSVLTAAMSAAIDAPAGDPNLAKLSPV